MSAVDRKVVRLAIASLLSDQMAGEGKPAQVVYPYKVTDFKGQSPVIVVMSASSRRRPHPGGVGAYFNEFRFEVGLFTADADEAAGWTDAMVEDRIDLLEKTLADVVAAFRKFAPWQFLDFEDGDTKITPYDSAGKPYEFEQVFLKATVY